MIEAILGGTFDPVHSGHLHAARIGCEALNAPTATLLLAARPSHRAAPAASVEQRWRMLELATRNDAGLRPSDRQIVRPGPSYTVDILAEMAGDMPLVWLIGSDALALVASWQRASELSSLCHFLVFNRPGTKPQAPPAGFQPLANASCLAERSSGGICYLNVPMLDISSTGIRRAIAAGSDASALLPDEVWAYIRANDLYRGSASRSNGIGIA